MLTRSVGRSVVGREERSLIRVKSEGMRRCDYVGSYPSYAYLCKLGVLTGSEPAEEQEEEEEGLSDGWLCNFSPLPPRAYSGLLC
jgi:hypothetical protein